MKRNETQLSSKELTYYRASVGKVSAASEAQLFGPLAVYHHQQRSERLAHDLSHALFPNRNTAEDLPLQVFFVARDGCTEDPPKSSGPKHPAPYPRYYHPSYLGRFAFEGGDDSQQQSVWGWIHTLCKGTKLNPHKEIDWKAFVKEVHHDGDAEWIRWQQNQAPRDAFELLVAAFSHLEYAGATPGELDRHLPPRDEFELHHCYPVFNIPKSSRKPLYIWAESIDICDKTATLRVYRNSKGERDLPVSDASFFELDEATQASISNLFFDFLDPFFSGQNVPRTQVELNASNPSGFTGIALPLYDRWESNGLVGAFVGWIFIHFTEPDDREFFFKTVGAGDENARLFREILRANLNDFADALAEHVFNEELSAYSPATAGTPIQYFTKRFHHIDGWIAKHAPSSELPEGQFFMPTYDDQGRVLSLLVRLDKSTSVFLEPKNDTLRPVVQEAKELTTQARNYFDRITNWARSFWKDLGHLFSENQAGLERQARAQFGAVGHELQNIVPEIAASPKWLRTIIQKWLLVYSLPAFTKLNSTHLSKIPSEIIGGSNPASFRDWTTQLVHLAAEIEAMVIPGKAGRLPKEKAQLNVCVTFICDHFVLRDMQERPPEDWRTRCYLGVIYLCALRNAIKHCFAYDSRSTPPFRYRCASDLKIEVSIAGSRLIIANGCVADSDATGGTKRFSDGTAGAINYYLHKFREAHPEIPGIPASVTIPTKPDPDGWHRLPLPAIQELRPVP
jgi:hypothetical protein